MLELAEFLQPLSIDSRLHPSHICLYVSMVAVWECSQYKDRFNVSRKQLMKLSKIKSTATYYKCIRELTEFGYIEYRSSYNPFKCSELSIIRSI